MFDPAGERCARFCAARRGRRPASTCAGRTPPRRRCAAPASSCRRRWRSSRALRPEWIDAGRDGRARLEPGRPARPAGGDRPAGRRRLGARVDPPRPLCRAAGRRGLRPGRRLGRRASSPTSSPAATRGARAAAQRIVVTPVGLAMDDVAAAWLVLQGARAAAWGRRFGCGRGRRSGSESGGGPLPPSRAPIRCAPVSAFAKVGIFALVLGAIGAVGAYLWLPDWVPPAAAVQAHRQDTLYLWLLGVSSIIFSVVVVFLGYSMWKFRARPGRHVRRRADPRPHRPRDRLDGHPDRDRARLRRRGHDRPQPQRVAASKGHMVVNVTGQQFDWSFTYPKRGHLHTGILALPRGPPGGVPPARAADRRHPQLQDPGLPGRRGRRARHAHDRRRHADADRHLRDRLRRAVRDRPQPDAQHRRSS